MSEFTRSATPGRTIQIYLPDGDPRGVRIAEFTTRIVQAVAFPRRQLREALSRAELSGPGVYYLVVSGSGESAGRAYVGESEDCAARLRQHETNKEFWQTAIVCVSRTGSFMKPHVRLLEWMSIRQAKQVERYTLENRQESKPVVTEPMEAEAGEIFETIRMLLGVLGVPLFEPSRPQTADQDDLLYCRRGGVEARGMLADDGFVVLEGSQVRPELTPSVPAGVAEARKALLESGVLVRDEHGLRFRKDHVFSSPSAASSMISGASSNGWVEWKTSQGVTLKDVQGTAERP